MTLHELRRVRSLERDIEQRKLRIQKLRTLESEEAAKELEAENERYREKYIQICRIIEKPQDTKLRIALHYLILEGKSYIWTAQKVGVAENRLRKKVSAFLKMMEEK